MPEKKGRQSHEMPEKCSFKYLHLITEIIVFIAQWLVYISCLKPIITLWYVNVTFTLFKSFKNIWITKKVTRTSRQDLNSNSNQKNQIQIRKFKLNFQVVSASFGSRVSFAISYPVNYLLMKYKTADSWKLITATKN